ncbi:WD40 repeat domain-containing protein, partial [Desulfococcaceae bacterium HSG9]|nr:WD40 repeat domain-containing protein [Desulfococcaceae bacterium HSG9]
ATGAGSDDKTARLWEVATGKSVTAFEGHSGSVNSVSFSPDGKYLATGAGSDDKTARLWEVATGKSVTTFEGHSGSVNSVSFSPDGKYLATGAGSYDSGANTARLWDLATGKSVTEFGGHSGPVWSVSFSPDGKYLATGSRDKTARLWDVAVGESVTEFRGYSGSVNSVSFSPDGKYLATGSRDNTARLWQMKLILNFLQNGLNADLFNKLNELSSEFPFRLNGVKLEKASPRFLPIRGISHPWQAFQTPRPDFIDPVEWMLASPVERGDALARDGRIEVAIAEFKKALAMDKSLNFNPKERAEKLAAPVLTDE